MRRADPQDPEYQRPAPTLAEQLEGTGLFTEPTWPERASAPREEQRHLPLPRSPEGRLAAWRATPDGAAMYAWIAGLACRLVAQGGTRLSAKHLLELARAEFRHAVDNRVTSALARSLEEEFPVLHDHFEKRRRAA